MLGYIGKRLLYMLPVVVAVIFLVFMILAMVPGDPARLFLGVEASAEDVAKLNKELGLDKPVLIRFVNYLGDVAQGNLGSSWKTKLPVLPEILSRFPVTLKLSLFAVLITIFIGIPIGLISAIYQYSAGDNIGIVATMTLSSIPSFWLGLMLILLFSVTLKWLPSMGIQSLRHYILPSVTASSITLALLIRMTRSSMLESIRQDYVRTARAKGCKESAVIINHALRNSLLPIVTCIGVNLGMLLGGTFIVETVFNLPGLGLYIVEAIKMRDTPAIMGGIITLAVSFSFINLIVDIVYALIDPRVFSAYNK